MAHQVIYANSSGENVDNCYG